MLYKKNKSKTLDTELFKNPTCEYRGTPFWAWNCPLKKDMLSKQIGYLKEMGFGGFHMHSRSGMATEYLKKDFMELIKFCRDKAEQEEMLAWLYDEDRWPSGAAGGYVTKTKKYRQKMLVFSVNKTDFVSKEQGVEEGLPYPVAAFDIELNEDGTLKRYKKTDVDTPAQGIRRYAWVQTMPESGWYNNQTYVDTLSKEAMQEFIKITYEAYKENIGESFGESVPAIFTDEPQFSEKKTLSFAQSKEDVSLPWTTDFPETYAETYGEDIIEKLPELFWDLPDGKISAVRYRYHDHVCERFTQSFSDQCGEWCDENGISLTGHMLHEETLDSQSRFLGEAMRSYRSFGIPGIDILCDNIELNTAKQAQSAVHQYGREAMLSELYGVTGWGFDFRGHKFQGDWQAALGVTVRVPHLSWVSMKGSAKRDYPASINYQSPWYKEYPYVEDHYARLNTVLTRGKPIVNVGVIHPVESYWLHLGPANTGSDIRKKLDQNFENLTKWLITGMVDFDFISESLLPDQCGEISDSLKVGEMAYKTIIVPGCETLRKTTLDILKKFRANGGRIIFMGNCPEYADAVPSEEIKELYNECEHSGFEMEEILSMLKNERTAEIFDENGETVRNLIQNFRQDGSTKWLFLAHCEKTTLTDVPVPENLTIILNGSYVPALYDTVSGEIKNIEYETKSGKTYIYKTIYAYDSLLLKLEDGEGSYTEDKTEKTITKTIDFRYNVSYTREENNVFMLDMAKYRLDDGELCDIEEIIKLDDNCRQVLGYPTASGEDAQPWILGEDNIEHYVSLYFEAESTDEIKDVLIAAEEAEEIIINGRKISLEPCGYYVDESIKTYKAGVLNKGINTIEIKAPIGKRTSIENFFLLGDFDVYVRGCEKFITKPSEKIGFSDISRQGLAFYGGNLKYKAEFCLEKVSDINIRVSRFKSPAVRVFIDGEDKGLIAYAPYIINVEKLNPGTHIIEFIAYGNRENTFDALHRCGYNPWFGPSQWYNFKTGKGLLSGVEWTYEYLLKEQGILSSPVIYVTE